MVVTPTHRTRPTIFTTKKIFIYILYIYNFLVVAPPFQKKCFFLKVIKPINSNFLYRIMKLLFSSIMHLDSLIQRYTAVSEGGLRFPFLSFLVK